jgi:hypothetical protein
MDRLRLRIPLFLVGSLLAGCTSVPALNVPDGAPRSYLQIDNRSDATVRLIAYRSDYDPDDRCTFTVPGPAVPPRERMTVAIPAIQDSAYELEGVVTIASVPLRCRPLLSLSPTADNRYAVVFSEDGKACHLAIRDVTTDAPEHTFVSKKQPALLKRYKPKTPSADDDCGRQ